MRTVRIASGSAFWGDALEPAIELAEKGDVQYIGFDHLAELTMSILARIRAKDPSKGYIPDLIPWMKAILPIAYPKGIKLITNAGGANPVAGGEAVLQLARELGFQGLKVGIVTGDDILDKLDDLVARGIPLRNLDTEEEGITRIRKDIVAANAYIGADSILDALAQGADVVVAGRVSDNALYVGPLMHEFGWRFSEPYWDRMGAAITVGHIIECAACCTGGMSSQWERAQELWKVGFPIAEVAENGDAVITKVPGSGGMVDEWTVKEHLLYEVHDPANYLMPDGIADFTRLRLIPDGHDRVKVVNMGGKPRPETLKVQIGYRDGFIGEGQVLFPWPDALARARKAEEIVRGRFQLCNLKAEELRFDYIGVNTLHGPLAPQPSADLNEVGLRVVARTRTYEEAEKVRREATHLWTFGPVGTAYGVPTATRPVISLWPTLVPRSEIPTQVVVKEA